MKRNTEPACLEQFIAHDTSEECRLLQHRLTQIERDKKCIGRAVFLVAILFMVSLAGVGYCAILLPEVLFDSRYHLLQSLCGLGLGSLTSLVVFLGYLLWKRDVARRLQAKCRLGALEAVSPLFKATTEPRERVQTAGVDVLTLTAR